VERFSRAMAHMQDIAQKISTVLGHETRAQQDLMGKECVILDRLEERPRGTEVPDRSNQVSRLHPILDGSAFTQRAAARDRAAQAAAQADTALRDFTAQQPYLWGGGGQRVPDTVFAQWEQELQAARQQKFAFFFRHEGEPLTGKNGPGGGPGESKGLRNFGHGGRSFVAGFTSDIKPTGASTSDPGSEVL
jgi:hypothetical protein